MLLRRCISAEHPPGHNPYWTCLSPQPTVGSVAPGAISKRARVEREMRRLAVLVRLLAVILLSLLARAVFDGLTVSVGVGVAVVVALLVFATGLLRMGRRIEIALSTSAQNPGRTR